MHAIGSTLIRLCRPHKKDCDAASRSSHTVGILTGSGRRSGGHSTSSAAAQPATSNCARAVWGSGPLGRCSEASAPPSLAAAIRPDADRPPQRAQSLAGLLMPTRQRHLHPAGGGGGADGLPSDGLQPVPAAAAGNATAVRGPSVPRPPEESRGQWPVWGRACAAPLLGLDGVAMGLSAMAPQAWLVVRLRRAVSESLCPSRRA